MGIASYDLVQPPLLQAFSLLLLLLLQAFPFCERLAFFRGKAGERGKLEGTRETRTLFGVRPGFST